MKITTVGQLKKTKGKIYVWVAWQGNDGNYIEMSRAKFLRGIGANIVWQFNPKNSEPICAEQREDGNIYIN